MNPKLVNLFYFIFELMRLGLRLYRWAQKNLKVNGMGWSSTRSLADTLECTLNRCVKDLPANKRISVIIELADKTDAGEEDYQ